VKASILVIGFIGLLWISTLQAQDPFNKGEDSLAVENVRIESLILTEKPELRVPVPETQFSRPNLKFNERNVRVDFVLPQASVRIPPPLNAPLLDQPSRYIKIGGGRFATTSADVYWYNGRNKNTGWGIDAHHSGMADGYLPYTEFLEHKANGHLNWYKNRFILGLKANFHQADYHHYGDPLLLNTLDQQLRTRRNWIRLNSDVSLKSNDPGAKTTYSGTLGFRVWQDNLQSQETNVMAQIGISTFLKDQLRLEPEYELIVGNNKVNSLSEGRIFNHLRPLIAWRKEKVEVKGGFGLNLYSATESETRFYPHIQGRFEMLKDRLEIGSEISGGMRYQMMYQWIAENPYLDTLTRVLPSIDKYVAKLYFSGKWAKLLTWKLSLHARETDRQAVYYSAPGREGYFTVLYDTGFVQQGIRLDWTLNRMKEWEGGGSISYNNNQTGTVAHFFHQPAFRAEVFLSWIPTDRLKFTLKNYTFGSRTMGIAATGNSYSVVTAPAFSDIGIGLEYRFYKRFSLFLEANNLAAQTYQRWYLYPERPLDFRGGLSAVF
jgi:hypothetical protein